MRTLYGAEQRILPIINHGTRDETLFIVVHDMEADDIDAVERYFAGGATPDHVGSHLGISTHGEVRQWADLDALVYHAIGANHLSPGIECCGFASFPRLRWLRRRKFRTALAQTLARLCHAYDLGIPIHRGTTGNVLGHGDVSQRYSVPGGHTDPGTGFPWQAVMREARKWYRKWYL